MNKSLVGGTILLLLILQSVQNDVRLLRKSVKNLHQDNVDFIEKVEYLFKSNESELDQFSMFYMAHNGDNNKIKHYFASQYVLAPKIISDKTQHTSFAKLQIIEANDGAIELSIMAPQ